ncbi:MAG: response regulator [Pirellulaceae bacterium]|nr:response regulator [Planctomycetales bacterium]
MKILIVDDSKAMRMIVGRALKQIGLPNTQIIEACDGTEAVNIIAAQSPDLVLSDWNMPQMKGIDLLRAVREAGNQVHFGFITSESGNEVREEAKAAGAAFIVTKPFTPDSLETAIQPILA